MAGIILPPFFLRFKLQSLSVIKGIARGNLGDKKMKQVIATPLKIFLLGSVLVAPSLAEAKIALDDEGKFKVYGDFRARLEADWDSQKSSGALRDDRTRARIRVRLGLTYTPTDNLEFGVRGRSGSDDSHQSPHITVIDFNDNSTGEGLSH